MSQQGSVFMANGAKKMNDTFSATSPAPANWAPSNANLDAKKIMNDIAGLLSEAKVQAGGKRKGSRKGSKKVAKKSSKKSSKSHKQKGGASIAPAVQDGGKKKSRGSSKKGSSKKGKKGSKQKGGKREMPQGMKNIFEVKNAIKAETDLKDGAPLTVVASKLIKEEGSVDKAIGYMKKNKTAVKKMYEKSVKDMADKRAAKKASKQ